MNPYVYPKARHSRSQQPAARANYRAYKEPLRIEFEQRCVYCCEPDRGRWETYHIDHYKPKKRFPQFRSDYSNLFYSCMSCNIRKGEFWPTRGQDKNGIFVPNPCDHEMFRHLRFRGVLVEPQSAAGLFALQLLELNDQRRVEFRNALNSDIKANRGMRASWQRALKALEARRGARRDARLEADIEGIQNEISELDNAFRLKLGPLAA